MKLSFTALMFWIFSASTAQSTFQINGTINEVGVYKKVLYYYSVNGERKSDSIDLINNSFIINGSINELTPVYLFLKKETNRYKLKELTRTFIIDQGKYTLKINKYLDDAQLIGSDVNDEFEMFKKETHQAVDKYNKLNSKYIIARKKSKRKAAFAKLEEFKYRELTDTYVNYINKHNLKMSSLIALKNLSAYNPDYIGLEDLWNSISNPQKELGFGKSIEKQVFSKVKTRLGKKAPLFSQNDTTGKFVSLTDFNGKYVLIDFWASWCGPCRAENPNVIAAYEKYKNKNFVILGVSLDKNKENWIKAIQDDKLPWIHVSDLKLWQNQIALDYGVSSIPTNFLVDPNGIIIAKNLRGPDLQTKLEEVLK